MEFFTIWINQSAAQSARSNRQYQLKGSNLKATKATAAVGAVGRIFSDGFFLCIPALTAHHGILYSLGKCANIHIISIKTRTDFECRYFFTYGSRNLQENSWDTIIEFYFYNNNLESKYTCIIDIPVVPGQAGGGSFQKEKNYIAQKEFAYRMCAWWPTSAMPKSFLCCERAFCPSMVVMFCALKWSVLMSWCLFRGQVMWWSRHLMRCDGLCCVMSRNAMRCHGD